MHEFDDFVERLTKSDHDSALGQHAAAFAIALARRALQQCQRLLVNRVGPTRRYSRAIVSVL